jgi:hypothetical protein
MGLFGVIALVGNAVAAKDQESENRVSGTDQDAAV